MNIYRYHPIVDKLFSPQDKLFYYKRRKKLESDVLLLKEQLNRLINVSKQIRNDLVSDEELYKLKYNVIDSFWLKKRQQYFELLHLYEQATSEIHNMKEKIISLESKLKNELDLKQNLSEELKDIQNSFDFSDFPRCSTSLSTKIIKLESDSTPVKISYDTKPELNLTEMQLENLREKLLQYDNSIDLDFHNHQKLAASLISSAQNSITKQFEWNSIVTDKSIYEFKQILTNTEEINQNLMLEIEQLRQKQFKSEFDFENEKIKLNSSHRTQIGLFKKHIMRYKHKIKLLKRSINEKADQYDSNCQQLLDTFSQFEQCLNERDELSKEVVNNTLIEEEEEEVDDEKPKVCLMNDLMKKKQSLEMDIKNLKDHLSQRRFAARKNSLILLDDIERLKKRDDKYQQIITKELDTMKTENNNIIDHDFNRIKKSISVFNDFTEQ